MSDKPVYRVGAAGLDPRDWRLIEIVFRHSQYNRFEFQLVTRIDAETIDLLIANPADPDGVDALACVGEGSRRIPFIEAVPRGAQASSPHAISIERLTLQLLPVLNRVVEFELQGAAAAPSADVAPTLSTVAPEQVAELAKADEAGTLSDDGTVAEAGTQVAPETAGAPERAAAPWAPGRQEGHAAAPPLPSGNPPAQPSSLLLRGEAPAPSAPVAAPQATPAEPVHPARDAAARAGLNASRPAPPAEPDVAAGLPAGMPPDSRQAERQPVQRQQERQEQRPQPARPDAGAAAAAARSNLVAFPRQNASERGASARLRVLVVDDSPTVRRQLGLAFERLGLECQPASSAAEALGMLDEGHFDLILVDVVMPDMDGYRLTREIKRNRKLRGLPVIILTSRSSPFDLARGALAGCDTYLTKPVPFRALEKAVVRQLRRSLAIDDLGSLVRSGAGPGAPEPSEPAASQPLGRVARLFGR